MKKYLSLVIASLALLSFSSLAMAAPATETAATSTKKTTLNGVKLKNQRTTTQMAIKKDFGDFLPNDGPITVEWLNPASNGDVTGMFNFKIKGTGGGGVDTANITIYTGGNPIKVPAPNPAQNGVFTIPYDTSNVPDGIWWMSAYIEFKNKMGTTNSIQANFKNAGPLTVNWINPLADATVAGKIDLKIQAKGGGGIDQLRVSYFKNGGWELIGTPVNPQNDIFTIPGWDTANITGDGTNFYAEAISKSGKNAGSNIRVHKEVQKIKMMPVDISVQPPAGTPVSGTVNLKATVSDNTNVAEVWFDGPIPNNPARLKNNGSATYELEWDTTKAMGGNSFTIMAYDKDSLPLGSKNFTWDVVNKPTVTITSPANGAVIDGDAVTFSADVTSDVKIDYVTFFDNQSFSRDVRGQGPYSITYDATKVADGPLTLSVTAQNVSNAFDTKSINVTVKNYKQPIVIEMVSPVKDSTIKARQDQMFTVRLSPDAMGVKSVTFDGWPGRAGMGPNEFEYGPQDTTKLATGSWTMTVEALDANDKVVGTGKFQWYLDNG